jgi:DNA-binding GntR family transcriptional regulator
LLGLRREIERLMVRLAARRRNAAEHLEFAEIAAAMEEAAETNNDERFMLLDKTFNALVGKSCHNAFAQTSMEKLNPLSRRFWFRHHTLVGDLPKMAALHADIAWAIVAGDEDTAARTSDLLVDYLTTFTRAALDAET